MLNLSWLAAALTPLGRDSNYYDLRKQKRMRFACLIEKRHEDKDALHRHQNSWEGILSSNSSLKRKVLAHLLEQKAGVSPGTLSLVIKTQQACISFPQ